MIQRPNPLNLEILGDLGPSAGPNSPLDAAIREVIRRVQKGNDARQAAIQKWEKLIRLRRGIRRPRTFPWPGATNHHWPLCDKIIRRWKPGMVALITQADPVSYFYPTKPDGMKVAPVAQSYYHWHFHHIDNLHKTAMTLVDYLAQYGLAYTRQGWNYRTEGRCRVINSAQLFPGGPEAATDAFNQQVLGMRAQVEQAVAAGQAGPETLQQLPQPMQPSDYVRQTLEDEFLIGDDRVEGPQLEQALEAILAGAAQVKVYTRQIVSDKPAWEVLSPLDVVVPPRCSDISNAEYVSILHRFTADDILRLARDGHFNPLAAATLAEKIRQTEHGDSETSGGFASPTDTHRHNIVNILDRADGINQGFVDDPRATVVQEIYCQLDLDGDGLLDRCVLWYNEPTSTVLALYHYPYPFRRWPLIQFEFEHTSPRPYGARGLVELTAAHQATANKLHNARLDADQIVLSPVLQMRATNGDVPRNIKFIPGNIIPVQAVGDIAPVPMDTSGLVQNFIEENNTHRQAEDYIGIFDPSVLSQNAQDRRTAREVDAVVGQSQIVFGQDAELLQDSMSEVHRQLWALIQEFSPTEEYFRVTGDQAPRLARKHELDHEYDIVPAGTPANTSRALAVQRAREALELFGPDTSGLIDRHELYTHYFDTIDPNLGKRIVRSPDQAAAIQQMMALIAQTAETPAAIPTPP